MGVLLLQADSSSGLLLQTGWNLLLQGTSAPHTFGVSGRAAATFPVDGRASASFAVSGRASASFAVDGVEP